MTQASSETGNEYSGPAPWVRIGHAGPDGKYSGGVLQEHDYSTWNQVLTYTSYYGYWTVGYADLLAPAERDPNLGLRVTSSLIEKVRGHSLNLGNDLATIKQTSNMVYDTARKLTASVLKLKKGNIPGALRALGVSPRKTRHSHQVEGLTHDDAAALWLEMQYGWKPLISDVYEAAKFMAEKNNGARGFRVQASSFAVKTGDTWSGVGGVHNKWNCREDLKIIAKISETLSVPRSLELDDPLSVAWEVLPWSFVVDWFIPIGTYLEALHIAPLIQGKFITCRKLTDSRITGYGYATGYPTPGGQGLYLTSKVYTRGVSNVLDVPLPSLKPIGQVISFAHASNALALLSQAIAKHPGRTSFSRPLDNF